VGLGLNEISSQFGWDLVVWKPILQQSEPKGALGPSEVQTEIFVVDDSSSSEGDSDSVLAEIGFEPVFDLYESGTSPEPVLNVDEAAREPPSVFEENVDDSFDRVVDFKKNEEVDTPIVIVQPKTIKIPQTGEGQKRKRIKMPAG